MNNTSDTKHIKISVIIPNYNGSKTLEKVLLSCINQTLPPFEILVCDDGSTDNSKKIINKINDSRIIWVSSLHSGLPAIPRNNGIKISKGEWIAFCDNDDEWLPTKLEKQIAQIKKTKKIAACTNALRKINGNITKNKVVNYTNNTIKFKNLLKSNDIIASSVIIHRSIYEKIGGFPEENKFKSFEDYVYWLRILTKTHFIFINEPLVIYDDHPETSIRSNKIPDNKIKKISFNNFIEWIDNYENNIFKMVYFKYKIKKYKIKQKIINQLKNIIKKIIR